MKCVFWDVRACVRAPSTCKEAKEATGIILRVSTQPSPPGSQRSREVPVIEPH